MQEVLDLLAMAPVRERFGISAEEMDQVRDWITEAGVRWGKDARHRAEMGQPEFTENTWAFGLSRLFLGIAMPDDDEALFKDTLPFSGIEGKECELLGKTAEFLTVLFSLKDACRTPKPAPEWERLLTNVLSSLAIDTPATGAQHRMIREALAGLAGAAGRAGFSETLFPAVVEQFLSDHFNQRPSVRGFLSGGVTFCNLLPMRSIPFKMVCLLGMNDGAFPRNRPPSGFDLTAEKPKAGDRSVRNDDRYLFLEALLSAREKLMIFYLGRSVSDNSVVPPSVVVGELLDTVEEGFFPEEAMISGKFW